MAENIFVSDLNLNGNQLKSAVIETLPQAPENPKVGQIYFNTTDNTFYAYGANGWRKGEVYACANPSTEVGAIGIYFGTENNTFKFRCIKAKDETLIVRVDENDNGLILLGVNMANLPIQPSVITKLNEEYYTRTEVDAKLSGIYRIKGTVDYVSELPDNAEIGDVYHVRYKGDSGEEPLNAEYAWIGAWEELGTSIDLSAYEILNADTTPSEGIQLYVDNNGTLHIDASGAKASWESYADNVLRLAKEYTDGALAESKEYSDQKLAEAERYTDDKIAEERRRAEGYTDEALIAANQHADQKAQEAKEYTDSSIETNSAEDRRYADQVGANVKQYTKQIMTEVEAGNSTAEVTRETVNEKTTYKVSVSEAVMQRIRDLEGSGKAYYYTKMISTLDSSPVEIPESEHKCGTNLIVQVMQNNKLVEVDVTIANGLVIIAWNGSISDPLVVIIFGIH